MNVPTLEFHNVEQNTDEWMALRAGKLTSSNLGKIMANYGKAFGEPAKKMAIDIALEQITGAPTEGGYSNEHMARGHEQEPVARMLYEEEMFCDVDNGGFFCSDKIGCSPDGLVMSSGLIEIKSVIPSVHFANVKRQKVDPAYRWQCIGNLLFTGRDWLDFVSYCALYPADKQLYVCRIRKEDLMEDFEKLLTRIDEFLELVESSKAQIIENNYRTLTKGKAA